MKNIAIFAHNPLNGGFDRLRHRTQAQQLHTGKDFMGCERVFCYGHPFAAPRDASDEDLEFICPEKPEYTGRILESLH
ncbi:hypothetical protein A6M27_10330 [Acidithiobacillus thiooxidans]|uniref:Uncharacterized protein n=1 Tax=Acidithiobacillus thiooxidans TaxID=930 RepID=A0A1C2J649_ACITH|nr:hypothetical protein [Acidithiobacillus thiooxidans]OCX71761.1 hypothetical protein A6P07_11280 [Acidithiobacillus thiooxidans]OCX73421.1 hypothetical protein A6O24_11495 [Acidithiobacillus thiooxidans]OCX83714.1 hypothetical protein A6O26_06375 [Acidithiobacillus thiooxidans]OCX87636.1 hypothetical protein A6M27_10330 [Acidithiobacillus thiooxidans]OFC43641.1 hypothetical protein BAE47_12750 [Acidithiobacillus thiooxidans]